MKKHAPWIVRFAACVLSFLLLAIVLSGTEKKQPRAVEPQVSALSCTPAQQQAGIKSVDDAIKCIGTQLNGPSPTPESVALACGLEVSPDLVNLISTLLATRKNPACTVVLISTTDAGPPKGPGI